MEYINFSDEIDSRRKNFKRKIMPLILAGLIPMSACKFNGEVSEDSLSEVSEDNHIEEIESSPNDSNESLIIENESSKDKEDNKDTVGMSIDDYTNYPDILYNLSHVFAYSYISQDGVECRDMCYSINKNDVYYIYSLRNPGVLVCIYDNNGESFLNEKDDYGFFSPDYSKFKCIDPNMSKVNWFGSIYSLRFDSNKEQLESSTGYLREQLLYDLHYKETDEIIAENGYNPDDCEHYSKNYKKSVVTTRTLVEKFGDTLEVPLNIEHRETCDFKGLGIESSMLCLTFVLNNDKYAIPVIAIRSEGELHFIEERGNVVATALDFPLETAEAPNGRYSIKFTSFIGNEMNIKNLTLRDYSGALKYYTNDLPELLGLLNETYDWIANAVYDTSLPYSKRFQAIEVMYKGAEYIVGDECMKVLGISSEVISNDGSIDSIEVREEQNPKVKTLTTN